MFQRVRQYFRDRTLRRRQRYQNWHQFLEMRFKDIVFPILIVEGGVGQFVESVHEYAIDPDLHFHEFDQGAFAIDSNGSYFGWTYDSSMQANLPTKVQRTMTRESIRQLLATRFPKLDPALFITEGSVASLFKILSQHL